VQKQQLLSHLSVLLAVSCSLRKMVDVLKIMVQTNFRALIILYVSGVNMRMV
jgi:hypothetical protein